MSNQSRGQLTLLLGWLLHILWVLSCLLLGSNLLFRYLNIKFTLALVKSNLGFYRGILKLFIREVLQNSEESHGLSTQYKIMQAYILHRIHKLLDSSSEILSPIFQRSQAKKWTSTNFLTKSPCIPLFLNFDDLFNTLSLLLLWFYFDLTPFIVLYIRQKAGAQLILPLFYFQCVHCEAGPLSWPITEW